MEKDYYNEIKTEFLVSDKNIFRFGSIGDGGYYINPNSILKSDILFSGGISSNIEFEYDIFRFNKDIKIFMVDPTVSIFKLMSKSILRLFFNKQNKLKYIFNTLIFMHMIYSQRAWHINKWLSDKNGIFDIIKEKLNNDYSKIILKLDIEGSEYDLLSEIENNLSLFNTMVFEFHDLDKKHHLLFDFIKKCSSEFNLVYIEINPAGGFDKHKRPKNIEISFERK